MRCQRAIWALGTVITLTVAAPPISALARPPGLPPPPSVAALPEASPAPPSPEVVALLDRVQDVPAMRPDGDVGVAAADASGQRLTASSADRPLLPASAIKLITAAAALRLLGPDFRFVTRVYATAPLDRDGVVDGDLVILGGGDPVLATERFVTDVNAARPATPLATLAQRVTRSGVRRVTGRVIGDPAVLADEPVADGWNRDYLASLDATRTSGLTVDAGLRLFERSGRLHAQAAKDPAGRTAAELHRVLTDLGVRIGHPPLARRGEQRRTVELARVVSPPLRTLLTSMLHTSDNHLADGIFRMLGATIGDATWAGSERAAHLTLSDADLDWKGVRLADGSGLSRRNRVSAAALVEILRVMAGDRLRRPWLHLQAVAGESGTMRRRLTDTQAEGRVFAKTGTLRDVRALAGTVPGDDGDDLHFAVLANDLSDYGDIAAARRLGDMVALALVVMQDGCRGPISPPDPEERRPPEALLCGPAATTQAKE